MENEYLKNIINELKETNIIQLNQIPDIDLYMDQVTTFVEDKLKKYKRNSEDKILTKTMINNYTKDGIINPPVKKKYSKNHILSLILIYHLKSILSISDIKKLSSVISNENINDIYDKFVEIQSTQNKNIYDEISSQVNELLQYADNEKTLYLLTVLDLIYQANIRKQIAEKIIDNYINS